MNVALRSKMSFTLSRSALHDGKEASSADLSGNKEVFGCPTWNDTNEYNYLVLTGSDQNAGDHLEFKQQQER